MLEGSLCGKQLFLNIYFVFCLYVRLHVDNPSDLQVIIMVPHLFNVMNVGAFSTRALVTLDTHLDIDAWLIPIVSPIDVWKDPDV